MQGFKIGIVWSLNCVGFAFWKIWTHPVFHILFFNERMQNRQTRHTQWSPEWLMASEERAGRGQEESRGREEKEQREKEEVIERAGRE
jgi:hypothetical protein